MLLAVGGPTSGALRRVARVDGRPEEEVEGGWVGPGVGEVGLRAGAEVRDACEGAALDGEAPLRGEEGLGAVLLSTRDTCANQAFRLGDSTYAFQYHVEVSEGLSKDWFEEYVSGEDSFAPKDDWEPLSDDRDVLALRSAHGAAVAEGSVARASAFTRALMRELVAKARRKRTATATLGALAALAAFAAAAAVLAARKRAY